MRSSFLALLLCSVAITLLFLSYHLHPFALPKPLKEYELMPAAMPLNLAAKLKKQKADFLDDLRTGKANEWVLVSGNESAGRSPLRFASTR